MIKQVFKNEELNYAYWNNVALEIEKRGIDPLRGSRKRIEEAAKYVLKKMRKILVDG